MMIVLVIYEKTFKNKMTVNKINDVFSPCFGSAT